MVNYRIKIKINDYFPKIDAIPFDDYICSISYNNYNNNMKITECTKKIFQFDFNSDINKDLLFSIKLINYKERNMLVGFYDLIIPFAIINRFIRKKISIYRQQIKLIMNSNVKIILLGTMMNITSIYLDLFFKINANDIQINKYQIFDIMGRNNTYSSFSKKNNNLSDNFGKNSPKNNSKKSNYYIGNKNKKEEYISNNLNYKKNNYKFNNSDYNYNIMNNNYLNQFKIYNNYYTLDCQNSNNNRSLRNNSGELMGNKTIDYNTKSNNFQKYSLNLNDINNSLKRKNYSKIDNHKINNIKYRIGFKKIPRSPMSQKYWRNKPELTNQVKNYINTSNDIKNNCSPYMMKNEEEIKKTINFNNINDLSDNIEYKSDNRIIYIKNKHPVLYRKKSHVEKNSNSCLNKKISSSINEINQIKNGDKNNKNKNTIECEKHFDIINSKIMKTPKVTKKSEQINNIPIQPTCHTPIITNKTNSFYKLYLNDFGDFKNCNFNDSLKIRNLKSPHSEICSEGKKHNYGEIEKLNNDKNKKKPNFRAKTEAEINIDKNDKDNIDMNEQNIKSPNYIGISKMANEDYKLNNNKNKDNKDNDNTRIEKENNNIKNNLNINNIENEDKSKELKESELNKINEDDLFLCTQDIIKDKIIKFIEKNNEIKKEIKTKMNENKALMKKFLLIKEKYYTELKINNHLNEELNLDKIKNIFHGNIRSKLNEELYFKMKKLKSKESKVLLNIFYDHKNSPEEKAKETKRKIQEKLEQQKKIHATLKIIRELIEKYKNLSQLYNDDEKKKILFKSLLLRYGIREKEDTKENDLFEKYKEIQKKIEVEKNNNLMEIKKKEMENDIYKNIIREDSEEDKSSVSEKLRRGYSFKKRLSWASEDSVLKEKEFIDNNKNNNQDGTNNVLLSGLKIIKENNEEEIAKENENNIEKNNNEKKDEVEFDLEF